MSRVKLYVPTLALLIVLVTIILAGPMVAERIAYAQEQGKMDEARDRLTAATATLTDLNDAFRSVARAVEPSVVHVSVLKKPSHTLRFESRGEWLSPFEDEFFERMIPPQFREHFRKEFRSPQRAPDENPYREYDAPREAGNGSGWVYRHASGHEYIITNHHVIAQADEIVVTFHDKSSAEVELVGSDPQTDIAVLKLQQHHSLHPATISTTPVEQGDIVFAMGSPFRMEFSMSQGIVSATGRTIGILNRVDPRTGQPMRGYENFIQTDAAINPGNSGGPLINIRGEVVGMSTAIQSRTGVFSGVGFAIPANMILHIADELIDDGKVVRAYMGVWIRDIDPELARTFDFKGKGVLIEGFTSDNSPAKIAGLQRDDIITRLNGENVTSMEELRNRISMMEPDETVTVTVIRKGQTREFQVQLAQLPDETLQEVRSAENNEPQKVQEGDTIDAMIKLGVERVATMTHDWAATYRIPFTKGILLLEVRPGSIADSKLLRPGMIITEVQGVPVSDVRQFMKELDKHDLTESVRFRVVESDGRGRSVAMTLPD